MVHNIDLEDPDRPKGMHRAYHAMGTSGPKSRDEISNKVFNFFLVYSKQDNLEFPILIERRLEQINE